MNFRWATNFYDLWRANKSQISNHFELRKETLLINRLPDQKIQPGLQFRLPHARPDGCLRSIWWMPGALGNSMNGWCLKPILGSFCNEKDCYLRAFNVRRTQDIQDARIWCPKPVYRYLVFSKHEGNPFGLDVGFLECLDVRKGDPCGDWC